jgi:glycosyltransferase involved in cell wall biosynthesis
LVDGWPLIYQPSSPSAVHLLTLLTCQPDGIELVLALPGEAPEWLVGKFNLLVRPVLDSLRQRYYWEQRNLPALAKEVGADLVHLSNANPALFTRIPYMLSPVDVDEPYRHAGIYARLRQALSAGGMSRLAGLVWPSDLPAPRKEYPVFRVMPAPPFGWLGENDACPEDILGLELPDTYILYHGPSHQAALQLLLETFRWAAGPVGENYPLLILGLDAAGRAWLPALLDANNLQGYVRALPVISTFSVPWLYRNCSVLFHPAEITPWGNPLRNALTYGRPVVAAETALTDALVGPAAYLVALDQPRELGAALLSVIVEEELAGQLSADALRRAASWQAETFCRELGEAYRILADGA